MQSSNSYSKIIAGTMTWGSWGKQFSEKQMVEMMHHCLQLGISTFDHADIYGDYSTEREFGLAFKISGVERDHIQLISKCGIQMNGSRNNVVKHYEYTEKYIIWSVEQSLKNLKTDYLDLLLLHRPSPLLQPDEVARAIDKLKRQGKIKDFGVSNFNPSQISLLESKLAVEVNQVEFSLTHNTAMYDGSLDDCLANERIAMSWSPLGSFFRERNETSERIRKCLQPLTEKYGATEDQLLLAWVLKHPAGVRPVVGTTTKSRLEMAQKAIQLNIELQDWFLLLEAAKGNEVP